jgi:hypothetical protein
MLANAKTIRPALPPPWSSRSTTAEDCTFQQLAPYIGRIKTEIARYLITTYTRRGDLLLDPFAGSGVIPFEAALLGRRVIAADISPYAYLLTTAKFSAPRSLKAALDRFSARWLASIGRRRRQDLRRVPRWVRDFFHPETLRNALALRDELVAGHDRFLMACLLGILHHQRPGFLSFPSSHLVPYLRDRLFPRVDFPDLYEERDVFSRMIAKIKRIYRRPPAMVAPSRVLLTDSRRLTLRNTIDAVITSPPYMNELDYVRDNRLRLWFLLRSLPNHGDIQRRNREVLFHKLITDTFGRTLSRLRGGGHLVLVIGDSRRGGRRTDAASLVVSALKGPVFNDLVLLTSYHDAIPDIRRTRRDLAGTKTETVLVYRKTSNSGR